MSIELPKDAEGREIPLDTKVLYDRHGDVYEVACYVYAVRQTISRRIWDAKMLDGTIRYTTSLYLTPPDSWEKLEDDLNRVVENNDAFYEASCAYMNQSGAVCNGCRLHGRHTRNCTEEMFKDVVSRIRKLKGED